MCSESILCYLLSAAWNKMLRLGWSRWEKRSYLKHMAAICTGKFYGYWKTVARCQLKVKSKKNLWTRSVGQLLEFSVEDLVSHKILYVGQRLVSCFFVVFFFILTPKQDDNTTRMQGVTGNDREGEDFSVETKYNLNYVR